MGKKTGEKGGFNGRLFKEGVGLTFCKAYYFKELRIFLHPSKGLERGILQKCKKIEEEGGVETLPG